jgi:hypothetical protein
VDLVAQLNTEGVGNFDDGGWGVSMILVNKKGPFNQFTGIRAPAIQNWKIISDLLSTYALSIQREY